jgi:hypothetical protein
MLTYTGGDVIFKAVAAAFRTDRSPAIRRTAGDALSDIGDARAAICLRMLTYAAFRTDRSPAIRRTAGDALSDIGDVGDARAAIC